MRNLLIVFLIIGFSLPTYAQNYKWEPIVQGIDCIDSSTSSCYVTDIYFDSVYNQLYVCGSFDSMAHIAGMARFDGITWKDMWGAYRSGRFMCRYKDKIISYSNKRIYEFDSTGAKDIGWTNDIIATMEVYNGELYVGGRFAKIGRQKFNHIARWDGLQWKDVGGGVKRTDLSGTSVAALKQFNGKLYVGGAFDSVGNVIKSWNIASWDGSNWSTVGGIGASWSVAAYPYLAYIGAFGIYKNQLYMGGFFDYVNGIKTNALAVSSDGKNWKSANYPSGSINCMKQWNDKFIIGQAGEPYIYQYDGTNYSVPDSGVNNSVFCLEVFNHELYCGGNFWLAGKKSAFKIAKLVKDTTSGVTEIRKKEGLIKIFPNPSDGSFVFTIQNKEDIQKQFKLSISDFVGREYYFKSGTISANDSVSLPMTLNLSEGIYLITARIGSENYSSKFVVLP